ncbi:dTDP-4-dehydrorhamnose reductase family protein [Streptomyces olivoreticuli]|uniref:dTDP-4-dehydrorhamnose reductase family protein n=1 Tax=Streptomyces olivoreticuli TaxID=68246 RepID=UPI000E25E6D7|nr:SDR family oxidoreductase [Streptomyces olivoreticuli]
MVFGASGLLGRSMMRAFEDWKVTGTSFRRKGQGLVTVDATSTDDVLNALSRFEPDVVINCVGERRPEAWANAPVRAHELNVEAARLIAEAARQHGASLLHISSDYVFDGTAPPYRVDARRNPMTAYGQWKLLAEDAVRRACPEAVILRLPVLYGPVEYAAETNLTQIARQVGSGEPAELDDVCVRYPTHVDEAAEVCRWLAAQSKGQYLGSVAHWSAEHGFTKYRMGLMIAQHFGIAPDHIKAGAASGDRPADCRLDCLDLRAALGWPVDHYRTFADEFPQAVAPWVRTA